MDFDWKIKGNQHQATREGYNLLDLSNFITQTKNGVTVVKNEDGSVKATGTNTSDSIISFDLATTNISSGDYVVSGVFGGSSSTYKMDIAEKGVRSYASSRDGAKDFAIEKDIEATAILYVYPNISINTVIYPMLYKGTDMDKPFEQYGALPSPDYPSEVETVKDNVEIDVVNKNIMPIVNLGTSWEYTKRGIKSFGKNKGTDITKFYIKKGQTIKIGLKLLSQSTVDTTFTWYVDNVPGSIPSFGRIQNLNLNQVYERSYTADKDCEIKGTRWGDEVSDIFEFQLWAEIDNLTNYIKHQSQTAIMPIQQEMLNGDYIKDVEHHEWKKVVLDGTENWREITTNNLKRFFYEVNVASINDNNSVNCISNYFKGTSRNKLEHSSGDEVSVADRFLNILSKKIETKEDFKALLKSKYDAGTPIIIYYKQAEAIDLELTSEQKAVREQKLYTYKNVTNIAVSDELASIDVTYKKDLETMFNNIIKQMSSSTNDTAET